MKGKGKQAQDIKTMNNTSCHCGCITSNNQS